MIRSMWRKLNCPHRTGRAIDISYDGVTAVECGYCKTIFHVPLSGRRINPGIVYRICRVWDKEPSHDNQ